MIVIIFIIIIYIFIINKIENFKNYNYEGPIIFLQKTDTKKRFEGNNGSLSENRDSTYRKYDNNITRITSRNYDDKLEIKSNDNVININNENDIKLQSNSKICINNECVERTEIEEIINILQ